MGDRMRLQGKRAVVTGGASGFGAGIVRAFVAEGARVAIVDLNGPGAAALAAELGGEALGIQVDVASPASIEAMKSGVIDAFGGVDILVNNAGIGHLPQALEDLDEAEFDRIFAVNAKSVYLTARAFVPVMKAGRDPQHRVDRRGQPAPPPHLVQRLQGLDDHRDAGHGG